MGTELAPNQEQSFQTVAKFLQDPNTQKQLAAALPSTITPERMARVALTALRRNPKLLEASTQSLAGALLTAAALGLEPDGKMGALVPYKGEIQFIAMYQGLIQLAYRSEQIADISAQNVYSMEKFSETPFSHKRLPPEERGAWIGTYGMFWIKGSDRPHVEFMWAADVNGIRNRAKARDSGPWTTDAEEMQRKTAVRRVLKYAPMSVETLRALDVADNQKFDFVDVAASPRAATADRAKAILGVAAEAT